MDPDVDLNVDLVATFDGLERGRPQRQDVHGRGRAGGVDGGDHVQLQVHADVHDYLQVDEVLP